MAGVSRETAAPATLVHKVQRDLLGLRGTRVTLELRVKKDRKVNRESKVNLVKKGRKARLGLLVARCLVVKPRLVLGLWGDLVGIPEEG